MNPSTDRNAAYLLLRLVLGLNIAMHGITRLISGTGKVAGTMTQQFASTPLPAWSVHLFAVCLPWAEAVIGLGLLLGIATRPTLLIGVLEILALTFGTTLRQDWEAAAIQLTYGLVYAILFAACKYNTFSVDGLITQRAKVTPPSTT